MDPVQASVEIMSLELRASVLPSLTKQDKMPGEMSSLVP